MKAAIFLILIALAIHLYEKILKKYRDNLNPRVALGGFSLLALFGGGIMLNIAVSSSEFNAGFIFGPPIILTGLIILFFGIFTKINTANSVLSKLLRE